MKLVHASLSIRKYPETRFCHCCPVKLVQASLGVRKDAESSFHHSVDIVKLVDACLSFKMGQKSISHLS